MKMYGAIDCIVYGSMLRKIVQKEEAKTKVEGKTY